MSLLKTLGGALLPRQMVILYHAVTPQGVYPVLDSNADAIHPGIFSEHLKWIGRFYDFAPLSDVVTAIRDGRRERIAAVTFDDGYKCVKEYAAPILADRNVPFTIFVVPELLNGKLFWRDSIRVIIASGNELGCLEHLRELGFDAPATDGSLYRWSKSHAAGNSRDVGRAIQSYAAQLDLSGAADNLYLTLEDIHELERSGVSFGNHTSGHYVLATLEKEEQRSEIADGANGLSSLSKLDRDVFSIPFGAESDWNSDTVKVSAELGYSTILSTTTARPRTRYHSTENGQVLEIRRALAPGNLKGLVRSIRGR